MRSSSNFLNDPVLPATLDDHRVSHVREDVVSCGLARTDVVIVVRSVSGVIYALRGRPTCGELREGTLGALQLIVFAIPERFWGKSLFYVR
jgi:hypothetical protein